MEMTFFRRNAGWVNTAVLLKYLDHKRTEEIFGRIESRTS